MSARLWDSSIRPPVPPPKPAAAKQYKYNNLEEFLSHRGAACVDATCVDATSVDATSVDASALFFSFLDHL